LNQLFDNDNHLLSLALESPISPEGTLRYNMILYVCSVLVGVFRLLTFTSFIPHNSLRDFHELGRVDGLRNVQSQIV
jgi:hypothetical protein